MIGMRQNHFAKKKEKKTQSLQDKYKKKKNSRQNLKEKLITCRKQILQPQ